MAMLLTLRLGTKVHAHDARCSMSQFPSADAWLLHPVSRRWSIPEIPLPKHVDEDQLNANIL